MKVFFFSGRVSCSVVQGWFGTHICYNPPASALPNDCDYRPGVCRHPLLWRHHSLFIYTFVTPARDGFRIAHPAPLQVTRVFFH